MVKGFWGQLKKPFFVLAPMEDVTDVAFRAMFAKYSRPRNHLEAELPSGENRGELGALWTEFTAADALSHPDGCSRVDHRLRYDGETERPIVAQIFGSRPDNIQTASVLCAERGFDGIDLNMGCPVKKIEGAGSCSGLIKTPDLAVETIEAARRGAGQVPVSVKTRIGYNHIDIEGWIGRLLEQQLPVLTVHLRTKKEMSDVPAHWELMPQIIALRNKISPQTLIIGNGDISSMDQAHQMIQGSKCDGIMIGRGAFGNPWFFREGYEPTIAEKLQVLVEHTKRFEKEFLIKPEGAPEDWHKIKNFAIMKKHFKAYVNGFDGAGALRAELMEAQDATTVEKIIDSFLKKSNPPVGGLNSKSQPGADQPLAS